MPATATQAEPPPLRTRRLRGISPASRHRAQILSVLASFERSSVCAAIYTLIQTAALNTVPQQDLVSTCTALAAPLHRLDLFASLIATHLVMEMEMRLKARTGLIRGASLTIVVLTTVQVALFIQGQHQLFLSENKTRDFETATATAGALTGLSALVFLTGVLFLIGLYQLAVDANNLLARKKIPTCQNEEFLLLFIPAVNFYTLCRIGQVRSTLIHIAETGRGEQRWFYRGASRLLFVGVVGVSVASQIAVNFHPRSTDQYPELWRFLTYLSVAEFLLALLRWAWTEKFINALHAADTIPVTNTSQKQDFAFGTMQSRDNEDSKQAGRPGAQQGTGLDVIQPHSIGQQAQRPLTADELVVQVKLSLLARGYDPGKADSTLSEELSASIAAFQRNEKLDVTGHLDRATIARLNLITLVK